MPDSKTPALFFEQLGAHWLTTLSAGAALGMLVSCSESRKSKDSGEPIHTADPTENVWGPDSSNPHGDASTHPTDDDSTGSTANGGSAGVDAPLEGAGGTSSDGGMATANGTAGSGGTTGPNDTASSGGTTASEPSSPSAAGGTTGSGGTTAAGGTTGSGGATATGGTTGSGGSGGSASTETTPCIDGAPQDFAADPLPCGEADLCDPDPLGRSFGSPTRIDDGTGCTSGTLRVVLVDGQPGIVAWLEDSSPRLRLRRVSQRQWGPHEELPSGFGAGLAVGIADSGHALVVGKGANRVQAVVSSEPGTFGAPSDIASTNTSGDDIRIAVDENGRAFAVWPLAESEGNIGTATWTAATGWTDLGPLTSGNPAVKADVAPVFGGGGFVVGFFTTTGVFAAIYAPNGVRTSTETVGSLGSVGSGERGNVRVVVDPTGAVHMVWTAPEPDAQPANLYYRLRRASDQIWFLRTVVDNRVDPSFPPLFSTNAEGEFIVAWRSADESRTQHAHLVRQGPATQDIRRFDAPGVQTRPAVAMDARGNALIVWSSAGPSGALVRANRYYAGQGWEHTFHRDLYPGETGETVPEVAVAMSDSGRALVAYVVRTANGNDRVYAHVLE